MMICHNFYVFILAPPLFPSHRLLIYRTNELSWMNLDPRTPHRTIMKIMCQLNADFFEVQSENAVTSHKQ